MFFLSPFLNILAQEGQELFTRITYYPKDGCSITDATKSPPQAVNLRGLLMVVEGQPPSGGPETIAGAFCF